MSTNPSRTRRTVRTYEIPAAAEPLVVQAASWCVSSCLLRVRRVEEALVETPDRAEYSVTLLGTPGPHGDRVVFGTGDHERCLSGLPEQVRMFLLGPLSLQHVSPGTRGAAQVTRSARRMAEVSPSILAPGADGGFPVTSVREGVHDGDERQYDVWLLSADLRRSGHWTTQGSDCSALPAEIEMVTVGATSLRAARGAGSSCGGRGAALAWRRRS